MNVALKQEIFALMDVHLAVDVKPSVFFHDFITLRNCSDYPLKMLYDMKFTGQSPAHHPEGNVLNHTMLVIDEAARQRHRSQNAGAFMWAALLHDIGKPKTTKKRNGRITSYDHEREGAKMAREFLAHYTSDEELIEKVCALVRWHMQILFVVNELPFADIKGMRRDVSVDEIALLGFCDRMGRCGAVRELEQENINIFLERCNSFAD